MVGYTGEDFLIEGTQPGDPYYVKARYMGANGPCEYDRAEPLPLAAVVLAAVGSEVQKSPPSAPRRALGYSVLSASRVREPATVTDMQAWLQQRQGGAAPA